VVSLIRINKYSVLRTQQADEENILNEGCHHFQKMLRYFICDHLVRPKARLCCPRGQDRAQKCEDNALMPSEATLKNGLHDRIKSDVLAGQFDEDDWFETRLGDFYRDDLVKIDIVVFSTTEQALHGEAKTLPDRIRRALLSALSTDTTPKSAVVDMFDACTRAVPISVRA
jgi:hypothetical protein